jgi:16S rRNA (uracil1498-N3)-methyltransferase
MGVIPGPDDMIGSGSERLKVRAGRDHGILGRFPAPIDATMPVHRFALPPGAFLREGPLVIGGDEGRHAARVKRLAPGDEVEVLDGVGGLGRGRVELLTKEHGEWTVRLAVERVLRVEPVSPRVVVLAPTPKGARLDAMIDGLSQVGAEAWRPLRTARTVVEPRESRLDRLARLADEANKQCGRPWTLRIDPPLSFADALRLPRPLVLAHADAEPYAPMPHGTIHLLIGPEGGWTPDELAAARAAGAVIARFGPHVMRVEFAAPVAVGIILSASAAQRPA